MKRWIMYAALGLTCWLGSAAAMAQEKMVTLVVPYSPGGAADQLARVIAQEMGTRFGQRMIVENRPGAGAQVAMSAVKNAGPSSGTVLFMGDSSSYSIYPFLYKNLNYDVAKDLIPLTLVAQAPVFLLVRQDSPFQSVQDLVTAAKGKGLTYGSPGVGTGTHLLGEMLAQKTGAKLVHVPYKGAGPALIDAVSGQIDFIFDVLIGSRVFLADGRLRAIAAATPERSPLQPAAPTLAESGIADIGLSIWWGIAARAGTSPQEVEQLSRQLGEVLKDPAVVKKFVEFGIQLEASSPEEFSALITAESKTFQPLIQSLNISLD